MNKVFVLILLAALSGCSAKPSIVEHSSQYLGSGSNYVYVVSHGWHTGFVVSSESIYQEFPELKIRFGNTENIEVGWGDKGFYQAEEITSGLTLRAIFWPTSSVIHAVAVPYDVRRYFSNSEIQQLCLTDTELTYLVEFISRSFARDDSRAIIPLRKGIYGNSQFYQGEGDYYLMNTCNKWTAKGLRSIGMDISPRFKLTAGSIMNFLKNRQEGNAFCSTSVVHDR